jgi:hypothetical protein
MEGIEIALYKALFGEHYDEALVVWEESGLMYHQDGLGGQIRFLTEMFDCFSDQAAR